MKPTDLLAAWGAIVATTLAVIRIWEVLRDRPRLTTTFSLSSLPANGGHTIQILNTGKVPALITYWEITWAHRWGLWTRLDRFEEMAEDGWCNITVKAHDRCTLTFDEGRWFDLKQEIEGRPVKLYLKLALANRRRWVWLKVWSARDR